MAHRVEMTGGYSRVPVGLRQPSRCLLTQKGCRHGANLPHGGGAWAGTETGEQGPKRVLELGRGHMARVAGTTETVELPRSPAQGSPASQGYSPAHTGAPPGSSVGGVRRLPACPLLRDSCPVSKGLFAERPPGLKGQHPEPQPASCHQGPGHLC